MSGSCKRKGEKSRKDKKREKKKRVESNRSKNLPYSEANCIIVLYTAQVLPFLLCDKRVAMYVGSVSKPKNHKTNKKENLSDGHRDIRVYVSHSLRP